MSWLPGITVTAEGGPTVSSQKRARWYSFLVEKLMRSPVTATWSAFMLRRSRVIASSTSARCTCLRLRCQLMKPRPRLLTKSASGGRDARCRSERWARTNIAALCNANYAHTTISSLASRVADQDTGGKYQRPAEDDLKRRLQERRVHIAGADPGDDRQFEGDDGESKERRSVKVRDEVGERMAKATERRHDPANRAADQRRAAPGQRAIVGQCLGKSHGDAGSDRRGQSDEKCRPGVVGCKRGRK